MAIITLEIAVDSLQCGLFAQAAGANRLEVCSRLDVGGCTPEIAMFNDLRRQVEVPLFSMIRPREGSFEYTADEIDQMVHEIELFRDKGANGFVCGPLDAQHEIDEVALSRFIAAADPLPITFHRAFDRTPDRFSSLAVLRSIGITRVLTSGGAPAAEAGLNELRALVTIADNALTIMPGGGVRPLNIRRIVTESGASEVHSSGRTDRPAVDPVAVKKMRKVLDEMEKRKEDRR